MDSEDGLPPSLEEGQEGQGTERQEKEASTASTTAPEVFTRGTQFWEETAMTAGRRHYITGDTGLVKTVDRRMLKFMGDYATSSIFPPIKFVSDFDGKQQALADVFGHMLRSLHVLIEDGQSDLQARQFCQHLMNGLGVDIYIFGWEIMGWWTNMAAIDMPPAKRRLVDVPRPIPTATLAPTVVMAPSSTSGSDTEIDVGDDSELVVPDKAVDLTKKSVGYEAEIAGLDMPFAVGQSFTVGPARWVGPVHLLPIVNKYMERLIYVDLVQRRKPILVTDVQDRDSIMEVFPLLGKWLDDEDVLEMARARCFPAYPRAYNAGVMGIFNRPLDTMPPGKAFMRLHGRLDLSPGAIKSMDAAVSQEVNGEMEGWCYFRHMLRYDQRISEYDDNLFRLPSDHIELMVWMRRLLAAQCEPGGILSKTRANHQRYLFSLCPYIACDKPGPKRMTSEWMTHIHRFHLGDDPRVCSFKNCEVWFPNNTFGSWAYFGHLRWHHKLTNLSAGQKDFEWQKIQPYSKSTNRKLHPERSACRMMASLVIRDMLAEHKRELVEMASKEIMKSSLNLPDWTNARWCPDTPVDRSMWVLKRKAYDVVAGTSQHAIAPMPKRVWQGRPSQHNFDKENAMYEKPIPSRRRPDLREIENNATDPRTCPVDLRPGVLIHLPEDCTQPSEVWLREGSNEPRRIGPHELDETQARQLTVVVDSACRELWRTGNYNWHRRLGFALAPKAYAYDRPRKEANI